MNTLFKEIKRHSVYVTFHAKLRALALEYSGLSELDIKNGLNKKQKRALKVATQRAANEILLSK